MHDKKKDTKSFITGETSFKWLLFFWQYCQEQYLKPNQKSMVEAFCKNSYRVLAVNFFCKKSPTINVRLCSKKVSIACKEKKKQIILYDFT